KAAEGAALGTETKMDYEVICGTHDLLINYTYAKVMQQNLEKVGGVTYTEAEKNFSQKIQQSFDVKAPAIETSATVTPLQTNPIAG
ncbi:hypothetical protein ABTQ08_21240, partial [Acinetobacter baumannii]